MKSMIKKCVAMSLVCVSAVGLLGGCGKKKAELDPDNPTQIKILTYYNGAVQVAFENLVEEFNDTVGRERGIYVESFTTGNLDSMNKSIRSEVEKKPEERDLPNIFCSYSSEALSYRKEGILASLDDYFTKEELAEYVDAYIEEGRIGENGELMVLPVAKSAEIMAVNRTDWEPFAQATQTKLSELSTWEGLAAAAQKYHEWSGGKALFGRDALANYMICGLEQLGGELYEVEDYKATLTPDKEVLRKLWDNYYVPHVKGYYAKYGKFSSDDMKTGGILSMVSSSAGAAFLPSDVTPDDGEPYPIELEIMQIPNFEGTEPIAIQQGAGMAVSKSNGLEEQAACIFLKWFTDTETNIRFAIASAYLPVKKEANDLQYVEQIAQKEGAQWNEELRAALDKAFETVQNSNLCITPLFDGGYECRALLQKYILDKAIEAREAAMVRVSQGEEPETVLTEYCSDQAFETWYGDLINALGELIG